MLDRILVTLNNASIHYTKEIVGAVENRGFKVLASFPSIFTFLKSHRVFALSKLKQGMIVWHHA